MKEITQYFRNAVAASLQMNIDFKNNKFATITWEEIESGKLNVQWGEELWKLWQDLFKKNDDKKEEDLQDVIIVLKTLKSDFSEGELVNNNMDEMSAIFFLPAQVDEEGNLYFQDDKFPWIPREYLSPMTEPQISVGTIETYDNFLEITTDDRNRIDSWEEYLEYAREMFETVTDSEFLDDELLVQQIKTDGKFYIFKDETVKATFHIMRLYDHLIETFEEPTLYAKIINGNIEKSEYICDKMELQKMMYHVGQMGGEYPLSPSQREAISCFQDINAGEVLAVNGPPGTGKTTLLQTMVANMYVEAAIKREDAPVIIATSTNNQAVTNIIDSFGKINPIGIGNLEKRWITGVHSFSVFFPSSKKFEECKRKNYQYTSARGAGFVEEVESAENRQEAKELFQKEYLKYFNVGGVSFEDAKEYLHLELLNIENLKSECVTCLVEIKSVLGDKTSGEYLSELKSKIIELEKYVGELEGKAEAIKKKGKELVTRCSEWRTLYNKLPWYVKAFKFIPYFKKKIDVWSYQTMNYEELDFLERGMDIDEIEEKYLRKIDENDEKLRVVKDEIGLIKKEQQKYEEMNNYMNTLLTKVMDIYKKFSSYQICVDDELIFNNFNIERLNNELDKVRYVEFWMAVHYYEALWLSTEYPIDEEDKGKNYVDVLNKMYRRLAMLSPCMVMTCFMLPKQFLAYNKNTHNQFFMYDYADLLIVDEAGQISPEIGAGAFAFAKKAVVVGDEQQIPPVWGTSRALDIAMAYSNKVISEVEDFRILEENGLNCSQSSIMKIASLSCKFEKYGNKGLFLSEHRRCYNEIVEYCNELVYGGNLEPLRGCASTDKNNVLNNYLPPMGHKQIESARSQRVGTSRQNQKEAEEIVLWLRTNYPILLEKYKEYALQKDEDFDAKSVIGIITPFKSQSFLIKRTIKRMLPEYANDIAVGTVHTFQGAERKVIIFSSVYGNQDGCYFINQNKSLMNVAVSRAKDSFLVFGDRGCLTGSKESAGVLLKRMTGERVE